MMNKIVNSSLFKNTGIYTLTSILNSAIPFLLLPILTRYMSPEDYGMVSMYLLLVSLATPFVGLNVNSAVTRKYYDKDEINIWEYVFNCLLILVASTAVVFVVFWVFAKPISSISQFPAELLWLTVVFSFGCFISSILLALWQVQKKAFFYGLFNILQTLTNVTLSIGFVVSLGLSWRGRIYGQLIAIVSFSLIALFILIKNKWVKFSYNKEYIASALMFGVPLIPHALSGSIISMTDRFFITNMIGLGATGIYTVGYQIGSIINLLAMSFNHAFVPWLFERLKQNNQSVKIKIVKFTYLYFGLIMLLALGLGLFAPPLLNIFLGKTFNESSIYVVWVALGYAFNGMYLMVVNYIFYSQKTKSLAMVTFVTAILNIGLNYVLILNYGAIGAAQATTIVFAIKFIVVFILSSKVHSMPWNLIKARKQISK